MRVLRDTKITWFLVIYNKRRACIRSAEEDAVRIDKNTRETCRLGRKRIYEKIYVELKFFIIYAFINITMCMREVMI